MVVADEVSVFFVEEVAVPEAEWGGLDDCLRLFVVGNRKLLFLFEGACQGRLDLFVQFE